MLKILSVMALASIPAFAGPRASVHEKALSKASGWNDVITQLKGRLPSNVVKEFADFSKSISFPTSRRIKNQLVLMQSDGTKVAIAYKKDGAISLNGKEWRLQPLATVEEEVSKLALFLAGEKKPDAGLFGLVPAAQAGGAGGLGAAAAAFAGANAWKAESCGEEDIQGDLVNDCPLMAVPMKPILVKARRIEDPNEYLPISLKCPAENSGIFELVSKNIIGDSERIRVSYKGKVAIKVSLAAAGNGHSFEEVFGANLKDGSTTDKKEHVAKKILNYSGPILNEVCLGSKKNKERYLASLRANREDLLASLKDQNESDEKSSVEAL